ncbi:synaptic vesicle glycoprotein 2A [Striga asiatica]|uniref:Synaptic vesicle glycoprotein 2A n=1 Tax=Striga asiatica TaxID=4170 RepID=A0A5A7RJ79_STRAF|nr:synaptic vesicle glycoprotein 2A [Striga asiatica]
MHHILLPPREKIVNHDHVVPPGDQLIHQMAPDKTGAAGDDYPPPLPPNPHRNPPHPVRVPIVAPLSGKATGIDRHLTIPKIGQRIAAAGGDPRPSDRERRLDDEEGGADQHANEDEEEALLAEDIAEGSVEGPVRLERERERFGGKTEMGGVKNTGGGGGLVRWRVSTTSAVYSVHRSNSGSDDK